MDTRFREYDRRNKWMPAFASMAEKYHSHTANCINNRYISIVKDIEGRLEMGYQKYESLVKELLAFAGIEINGSKPWDIQVYNKDFYKRVITEVELGIGESYMDSWWDVEKLDEMIFRIVWAEL